MPVALVCDANSLNIWIDCLPYWASWGNEAVNCSANMPGLIPSSKATAAISFCAVIASATFIPRALVDISIFFAVILAEIPILSNKATVRTSSVCACTFIWLNLDKFINKALRASVDCLNPIPACKDPNRTSSITPLYLSLAPVVFSKAANWKSIALTMSFVAVATLVKAL